jgi:hypothetical protein
MVCAGQYPRNPLFDAKRFYSAAIFLTADA